MVLGPVEILVLSFPENRFTGGILPELTRLVSSGIITVIDGLLIRRDEAGETAIFEFDELDTNSEVAALSSLVERVEGLISDEDVSELTAGLAPNSSAAILVFEHTWAKPLSDTIVDSGGVLLESIRVPRAAVEEVLAAISEATSSDTQ